MDEAYARLSLLAGLFAGAADQHLGRDHFASRIRAEAWSLTAEKLARWHVEAADLGVPAEKLRLPPEITLTQLLVQAQALQQYLDRAIGTTSH